MIVCDDCGAVIRARSRVKLPSCHDPHEENKRLWADLAEAVELLKQALEESRDPCENTSCDNYWCITARRARAFIEKHRKEQP